MDLTEIIFRLFAWLRPLLWCYHRLNYFLTIAIRYFEDEECVLRLFDHPGLRARVEGMLVDAERCLGTGDLRRIHAPLSLERLAAQLDRLVDRYNDIERLARLRAGRLRREMDVAPVLLVADHRPASSPLQLLSLLSSTFFFLSAVFPAATLPAACASARRRAGLGSAQPAIPAPAALNCENETACPEGYGSIDGRAGQQE